jgi:hypothetical protein
MEVRMELPVNVKRWMEIKEAFGNEVALVNSYCLCEKLTRAESDMLARVKFLYYDGSISEQELDEAVEDVYDSLVAMEKQQ